MRALYGFIQRVVRELNGKLQVIVVGHADLADLDWFEDARVEDWKVESAGLVPQSWLVGTEYEQ